MSFLVCEALRGFSLRRPRRPPEGTGNKKRGSNCKAGERWVQTAPGFAQGFPHDSTRPPPAATGQYGLNVRAPFAAPRGSPAALLAVARCRAGQVLFFAHPPIAQPSPTPCHSTPSQLYERSTFLPHQRGCLLAGKLQQRKSGPEAVKREAAPAEDEKAKGKSFEFGRNVCAR